MNANLKRAHLAAVFVGTTFFAATIAQAAETLPSWNDGKARQSIVNFVARVTKEGSADFVPPAERIATFDNDGRSGPSSRSISSCFSRWSE
jgi:hypothetical protein